MRKICHLSKDIKHVTCHYTENVTPRNEQKYATCHYGQNMSRVKAQKKMSHVKTHKTCHLRKSTNNLNFQSARTMTPVKTQKKTLHSLKYKNTGHLSKH